MFTPTRDEARRFLVDAWRKYRGSQPLSALEQKAVALIAIHPEYHALLEDGDAHLARDYHPEQGEINPFLHLSLHLAVAEQMQAGGEDAPRVGLVEACRLGVGAGARGVRGRSSAAPWVEPSAWVVVVCTRRTTDGKPDMRSRP